MKNRPCYLLLVLIVLSGCGVRLKHPASHTIITPADLHQDDDTRTIDLSYRFTGHDGDIQRLAKLTIAREFENAGYIIEQTPWENQAGQHTRLQMEIHHDSDLGMAALSFFTLGAIPENRELHTTITTRALTGKVTNVYEEDIVIASTRWLPILAFINPPPLYPDIAADMQTGMNEAVRRTIRRLREDRLLAPAVIP